MGQRDALLVFRTLCKMAMKEGKEELIVRTKVLSLELLQGLLESVSRDFTVNFAFIDSIKMYLCYALVRAYVSPVEKVFQLACNIFATLVTRFRESLKVCALNKGLRPSRTYDACDTMLVLLRSTAFLLVREEYMFRVLASAVVLLPHMSIIYGWF